MRISYWSSDVCSSDLSQSLFSGGYSCFSVITGHSLVSSAFSSLKSACSAGRSSSAKIALAGHSGSHSVQSIHSSGSITRKFGPSWKQSTGQTSTQSVYLHLMRSEEHTSELQSLMRISYAVFCLKKKIYNTV